LSVSGQQCGIESKTHRRTEKEYDIAGCAGPHAGLDSDADFRFRFLLKLGGCATSHYSRSLGLLARQPAASSLHSCAAAAKTCAVSIVDCSQKTKNQQHRQ